MALLCQNFFKFVEKTRNICKDKHGDAMLIFIATLALIFGIILINFTGVIQTSTMRQKIYNAVQDGLTLSRAQALKTNNKKVVFSKNTAKALITKCLNDNNMSVSSLNTWYSNNRIYASGKVGFKHLGAEVSTTRTIPFEYSIEAHRNFR
jgi:Tfp pilus assembly protein FimT